MFVIQVINIMIIQKLFTEKFRPASVEAMILLPRIKEKLFKDDQLVLSNNLLLTGTQGTGKTSLANLLASQFPTLKINASYNNSIDDLREEVTDFCRQSAGSIFDQNWDPSNKWKIVYFDEFDGISNKYQDALRGFIEEHSDRVRFIATCNKISNISPAIQSRFKVIQFDPINMEESDFLKKEYLERCQIICNKVGLKVADNWLINTINQSFPDLRSVFNTLQEASINGIENTSQISQSTKLFDLFKSAPDTEKTYNFVMENYGDKIEPALKQLGRPFAQWIFANKPESIGKIPTILPKVVWYSSILPNAMDPLVLLTSLIYEIQEILNKK